jgi:DNA-binding response OmpR family regulator
MRILVIEDDPDVSATLRLGLEAECFAVDTASDGEQGSYLARTNDYDMVLLDYVLPKQDGKAVCADIRKSSKNPYIMMLSVKAEPKEKANILNIGADDYLTKPFSFEELIARIRAIMRRPRAVESEILSQGDIVLDTRSHTVLRDGQEVNLTRKEYMVLEYLMRHKGTVVSRSMLGEHVWDSTLNAFSNTIESHILSLRKKLDGNRKPGLIHTIQGRGYRIGNYTAPAKI